MTQINKNRLIGGSVIVFSALLFAPAIMTPESHGLKNPEFSVKIDKPINEGGSPQIAQNQQKTANTPSVVIPPPPALELESAPSSEANGINLALESSSPIPSTNPMQTVNLGYSSAATKPSRKLSKNKESWLRVGSFASDENANSLLRKLKPRYSAKVEKTTINGKIYHRVLVGPYSSEKALQSAKRILAGNGYNTSIQR